MLIAKTMLAVLASLGYAAIYLWQVRRVQKETSDPPRISMWAIWGINLSVGASVQFAGGGGIGVLPAATDALLTWVMVAIGVCYGSKLRFTNTEKTLFAIAILGAVFRLPIEEINNPFMGGLCASVSSFSGAMLFAWDVATKKNGVSTEPPVLYVTMGCLAAFAAIANHEYNILTLLYVSQYAANVWIVAGCLYYTQRSVNPEPSS